MIQKDKDGNVRSVPSAKDFGTSQRCKQLRKHNQHKKRK